MSHVLTIIWDFSPEIFPNLDFPVLGNVRWYGVLWALSFIIGHYILDKVYKIEGRDVKELDNLFIYTLMGGILGARLGHCLFYQPEIYLSNPLEILKIWEGGLASHGGAFGLIIAFFFFFRKYKLPSFAWLLDRVVIAVALAGALIRFGNYLNSEIIGKPTDSPVAIAFVNSAEQILNNPRLYNGTIESIDYKRVDGDTLYHGIKAPKYLMTFSFDGSTNSKQDHIEIFGHLQNYNYEGNSDDRHFIIDDFAPSVTDGSVSKEVYIIPRHPAQLYESLSCLIIFFILLFLYFKKYQKTLPDGLLIGLFLITTFSFRFLYELIKENQVAKEATMSVNIGQILSFPLIALGMYFLYTAYRSGKNNPETKISE